MRAVVAFLVCALSASSALALPANPLVEEETVAFTDYEVLSENITADVILIHAGCCGYTGDITLHARRLLQINGGFHDADGRPSTLTLISDGDLVIAGGAYAASGASSPPTIASASATGAPGEQGGSLILRWGAGGVFTLAAGARLRSGAGGEGGSVSVVDPDPKLETIARGGLGGDGGQVILDGVMQNLYGDIVVGNGGRGGDATIVGSVPSTSVWRAEAGRGGNSRLSLSSPKPTAEVFIGLDKNIHDPIVDGVGGSGGEARVVRAAMACGVTATIGGDGGAGWRAGGSGGSALADASSCLAPPGINATAGCVGWRATPGGIGGAGAPASSIAGRGGPGVRAGGAGGDAVAWSGAGGPGGKGGTGTTECYSGEGGRGGSGGQAEAFGGSAGCAFLLSVANPGRGTAVGGRGGPGGAAGDGPYPWHAGEAGDDGGSIARDGQAGGRC